VNDTFLSRLVYKKRNIITRMKVRKTLDYVTGHGRLREEAKHLKDTPVRSLCVKPAARGLGEGFLSRIGTEFVERQPPQFRSVFGSAGLIT